MTRHLFVVITLNWPSFSTRYILSVTLYHSSCVSFHYEASVCELGHHGCCVAAFLPLSYRRILGADLSSVIVLRSLTPRRIDTSISLSSCVMEDGSWGAHRAGSPGSELWKGK